MNAADSLAPRWAQDLTRRHFLSSSGYGLGLAALGQLLAGDELLGPSRSMAAEGSSNPSASGWPGAASKAA
jgi:hypothetical protein